MAVLLYSLLDSVRVMMPNKREVALATHRISSFYAVTERMRANGNKAVAADAENGLSELTADLLLVLPNQGRGRELHTKGVAAEWLIAGMLGRPVFDRYVFSGARS